MSLIIKPSDSDIHNVVKKSDEITDQLTALQRKMKLGEEKEQVSDLIISLVQFRTEAITNSPLMVRIAIAAAYELRKGTAASQEKIDRLINNLNSNITTVDKALSEFSKVVSAASQRILKFNIGDKLIKSKMDKIEKDDDRIEELRKEIAEKDREIEETTALIAYNESEVSKASISEQERSKAISDAYAEMTKTNQHLLKLNGDKVTHRNTKVQHHHRLWIFYIRGPEEIVDNGERAVDEAIRNAERHLKSLESKVESLKNPVVNSDAASKLEGGKAKLDILRSERAPKDNELSDLIAENGKAKLEVRNAFENSSVGDYQSLKYINDTAVSLGAFAKRVADHRSSLSNSSASLKDDELSFGEDDTIKSLVEAAFNCDISHNRQLAWETARRAALDVLLENVTTDSAVIN